MSRSWPIERLGLGPLVYIPEFLIRLFFIAQKYVTTFSKNNFMKVSAVKIMKMQIHSYL